METFWKEQMEEQGKDGWYGKALEYWDQQPASVDGVLGGYGSTTKVDLRESRRLLETLKVTLKPNYGSVLDCGAGMGRISDGLLMDFFETVDLIEPCKKQIEKAQKIFEHRPKARNFFCKSLQDFHFQKNDPSNLASTPTAGEAAADDTADKKADDKADEEAQAGSGADAGAQGEGAAKESAEERTEGSGDEEALLKYDCVWNQWVLLYLTDEDLIAYLQRCQRALKKGGFIFAKENVLVEPSRSDPGYHSEMLRYKKGFVIDEEDNGLTRADARYRELFKQAGLKLVAAVRQANWPTELYPIYMYVLQ